jgi:hypothetical protein
MTMKIVAEPCACGFVSWCWLYEATTPGTRVRAEKQPADEKKSCGPTLFFYYFGKLKMPNTWRYALFLLFILFWELPNHKICQVEFDKLLEMLLGVPAYLTHLWNARSCGICTIQFSIEQ